VIDSSDYDGGIAVENAITDFVDKYSALAVGNDDRQKVPGRDIYVYDGDGTFDADEVNTDRPYTIIIDNPNAQLEIDENLTNSAMYVIRQ
jgi:hypothetical protein